MIYCRAILPRAGLGNRLFPWARCRLFSKENSIGMLLPTWAQLKIGSILRGETDFRFYLDLFRGGEDYIQGFRKLYLQILALKLNEPENWRRRNFLYKKQTIPLRDSIFVFRGERDRFKELNGYNELLLDEIRLITKRKWLEVADKFTNVPVGIHVRRGDFFESSSEEDFYKRGGVRTPISWFVNSLRVIRKHLHLSTKAFIFSDGSENDIKELLAEENTFFTKTGSAISDLLILSKAKILIASGGSSFSAWASFLGQMPTISCVGQSLSWFKITSPKNSYIGEFDPFSPNQVFLDQANCVLQHRQR